MSRRPHLLNSVLKAITTLNDSQGSTTRRIIEQIETTIRSSPRLNPMPPDLRLTVRRALQYGVQNGLLTERGKRYKLEAEKTNVMRPKKSLHDESCSKANKKANIAGKLSNNKNRAPRSGTISGTESSAGSNRTSSTTGTTDATSISSTSRTHARDKDKRRSSTNQAKRRRRRSKSRRRRRKRRRQHSTESHSKKSTSPCPQPEPDPTPEAKPDEHVEMRRSASTRHSQRLLRHRVEEDECNDAQGGYANCNNEECLCQSINQEQQNDGGSEVEGPSDDYIN